MVQTPQRRSGSTSSAGEIMAIGSGRGRRGRPDETVYASAKAGPSMLIRVLALELWQHNFSVSKLARGPVLTGNAAHYALEPGSVFRDGSVWVKTPEGVVPRALFLATQPNQGPTARTYGVMRHDMERRRGAQVTPLTPPPPHQD